MAATDPHNGRPGAAEVGLVRGRPGAHHLAQPLHQRQDRGSKGGRELWVREKSGGEE